MYIENLAINNLQWSICHKTKPNQTKSINQLSGLYDLRLAGLPTLFAT